MRRRARNWAESSTPSATVTSGRLCPRRTMVRASSALSLAWLSRSTNERSILSRGMNSVGGTSPGPGDASGPGLGAHDLARGQVEGGLVVQEQLALVQGPAQVGLQLDPGHQLGVHLRVVAGKAALA